MTATAVAPSTTWAFVTIKPSFETTKPEPVASPCCVPPKSDSWLTCEVTFTTESFACAYTCAASSVPFAPLRSAIRTCVSRGASIVVVAVWPSSPATAITAAPPAAPRTAAAVRVRSAFGVCMSRMVRANPETTRNCA